MEPDPAHTGELPPKPDPQSGEPRPPRAPGFTGENKPAKSDDRNRDQGKPPDPPDGEGPVLEWHKHSQRYALQLAGISFIIFVVGVTLMQGISIAWMGFWWMWLLVLLFTLLMYAIFRSSGCAAGAEWLKVGKQWVRLYELTSIKGKHRSNALHLDLMDTGNRLVQVKLDDLQENRDLWDLVYNGMLHSVTRNAATANKAVHRYLRLPRVGNPPE